MTNKTDKPNNQLGSIAKNAGLGIVGQLFFFTIRFAIVVLITRTCGADQYGIFVLSMNIIVVAEALGRLGLDRAMVRYVSQYLALGDKPRVTGIIRFGFNTTFFVSLGISIIIFIFADQVAIHIFDKVDLAPILRVMVIAVPFACCRMILLAALQGAKLIKYDIYIKKFMMPVVRLVLIATVFLFGYRLMGVTVAWATSATLGFVAAIFFVFKRLGSFFHKTTTVDKKDIFAFSLPLLLSRLLSQNINTIGILIVGGTLAAAQVGVYGVAMRVIPILSIPTLAINAIFSPIIPDLVARKKMDELESTYKTCLKWVLLLVLPIFTLLVFFSRQIVSIFGPEFADSANIMIVLLVGQLANVGSGSSAIMLAMTGKSLYNLFNTSTLCVVNIILTIVFIHHYGTIGASIAFSLSIFTIQVLQTIEIYYLYRIHPFRLDHLKPFLACILAWGAIYGLDFLYHLKNSIITISALILVFMTVYFLIVMVTGLSPDDRFILDKAKKKLARLKG